MKYKFIDILLILSIILILTFEIVFSFNLFLFCLGLLLIIPLVVICFMKAVIVNIRNKVLHIFCNSISFISFIIIVLFTGFCLYSFIAFHDYWEKIESSTTYKTPSITEYKEELNNLTEKKYALKHFPEQIPPEAENYEFKIKENKDFNYLMFNIDEDYINKINKKNDKNIFRTQKYEKICNSYIRICDELSNKNLESKIVRSPRILSTYRSTYKL